MAIARFSRMARKSTVAPVVVISMMLITTWTTGAQASTSSTASPRNQICHPKAGTIMTSKATSKKSSWSPTNLSSSYLTGPGTIHYTQTATSSSSQSISASFTLDEGLLFVSAHEQYGLNLERSHSQSAAWSYDKPVPKGRTERLQQYHQSWELGIKQTYMGHLRSGRCHVYTETSRSGNFFPSASNANVAFCYGLTPHKHASIQVRRRCKDL
jgi:hypothetical protein